MFITEPLLARTIRATFFGKCLGMFRLDERNILGCYMVVNRDLTQS